jgi:heavy metal sensor kinase
MDARRRPFYRSIRFRLTAWYTFLLIAALFAIGLTLSLILERELRQDLDQRLRNTAIGIRNNSQFVGEFGLQLKLPELDPIASSGLYIQTVQPDGRIADRSDSLKNAVLPVTPPSGPDPKQSFETVLVNGTPVRAYLLPLVTTDGRFYGTVVVGASLESITHTVALERRLLLWVSGIGVVLAAIGGWLLAGRALRPVANITATANSIAVGAAAAQSLTTRLEVPDTGDELARLALTFNRMLDRLEETFRLQRRFIADASHELRTPLTAIRGNIDVLLRQASTGAIDGTDLSDALDDLRRESARMSRLIEDLLTLARTEAPPDNAARRGPMRLDGVVDDALRTAAGLATGQRLRLVAVEPIIIVAERDRITELLLILIDNAIRHTPPGGEITVSVERVGSEAQIAVSDTGEGIAPEDLPHVFERFYRAGTARDRATGGTGLGLAIAQSIARLHGGEIGVTSSRGAGATFTVTLPLDSRPHSYSPAPVPATQ